HDLRGEAAGGNRDAAVGHPASEIRGENLNRSDGVFIIGQWFAHTHHDNIIDVRSFGGFIPEGSELPDNFSWCQITLEALACRQAEFAAHRASGLRGYADGPVAFPRDENAFDEEAVFQFEKSFLCAVT